MTTTETLIEGLRRTAVATLENLGGTADGIAATLRGLGIRGRRRSCSACPLGEALTLAGYYRVTSTLSHCEMLHPAVPGHALVVEYRADCKNDVALRGFLRRYDAGQYPSLETDTLADAAPGPVPPSSPQRTRKAKR